MSRNLVDFVSTFQEVTKDGDAPELFRKWAGIVCVAGALERKAWALTRKNAVTGFTYPTLGVFTIAEGGVGKKTPIAACEELWRQTPRLVVAPKSLTHASFYDAIMNNPKKLSDEETIYHPILVASEEIGAFFLDYDRFQLSAWCQAIDCDSVMDQQRRGMGNHSIGVENPCISFILAGQPSIFNTLFPESAYGQGFMGRTIIIHESESDPSTGPENSSELWTQLKEDIQVIADLEGEFSVESGLLERMEEIKQEGKEVGREPPHPRLAPYFRRKHVHAAKVAMALSASRRDTLDLRLEEYEEALSLLAETEPTARKAFQAAKNDEDAVVIDEVIANMREKGTTYVTKRDLYRLLYQNVSSQKIPILIDTMVHAGLLKTTDISDKYILSADPKLLQAKNVVELEYGGKGNDEGTEGPQTSEEAP